MNKKQARFIYALMDNVYVSMVSGKNALGMKKAVTEYNPSLKDIKAIQSFLYEIIKK